MEERNAVKDDKNLKNNPENDNQIHESHTSIVNEISNNPDINTKFLRLSPTNQPIPVDLSENRQKKTPANPTNLLNADELLARELQMEEQQSQFVPIYPSVPLIPPNIIGCLNVNVIQAQLNKSYGLVRMDPYVKLRIGNYLFETSTDTNGSTTPTWNQMISGYVAKGISSIYIEIFDERSFTEDEKIAWTIVPLAPRLFQNETVDEWYPLSGKLGPDKEGQIHLIMNMMPTGQPPTIIPQAEMQSQVNTIASQPNILLPNVQPPPNVLTPQIYGEIIGRLKEMFPSFDQEIIASVFEANSRSEALTINALLALNDK